MSYFLLLMWLGLIGLLGFFLVRDSREGGALTLAYFLSLSMIHVPGMFAHLEPNLVGSAETVLGFELTLAGLAAFLGGWATLRLIRMTPGPAGLDRSAVATAQGLQATGVNFVLIGIFIFFVVLPIAALVQSLTSILSGVAGLLVLGIWLLLYSAVLTQNYKQIVATLFLLPLLPLATLVTGGFLSFGVQWILSALCFLFIISRKRLLFVVISPVVMYIGLSIFVTYMAERSAIRDAVWYEQASLGDRLDRISSIITNFQLLDVRNPRHADALDVRLNQNFLVGKVAARHQDGFVDLAYGGTLPWWSLIPRALWPDKPAVAGGSAMVAKFTGEEFAEGTTVGAGQVLEFYANFGVPGIIGGFFILGALLSWLDRRIMRAVRAGNVRSFLLTALPGLALLQPGGNLLEVVVSTVAAVVAAHLLVRLDTRLTPVVAASVTRVPRVRLR